jgi:polar amino acid transport system permease protein
MLAALILFDAVYLAEIVRAGLRSVPRGQTDAARALGLGEAATLRLVVLPQALRAVLPSLVNQFVATIKATSLGYIIGLNELSFVATQVNTLVFTRAAEVYTLLALGYFVLCFGLSRLAFVLERRVTPQGRAATGHGPRVQDAPALRMSHG